MSEKLEPIPLLIGRKLLDVVQAEAKKAGINRGEMIREFILEGLEARRMKRGREGQRHGKSPSDGQ